MPVGQAGVELQVETNCDQPGGLPLGTTHRTQISVTVPGTWGTISAKLLSSLEYKSSEFQARYPGTIPGTQLVGIPGYHGIKKPSARAWLPYYAAKS
eukprot:713246-Rhodomonas_salina.2